MASDNFMTSIFPSPEDALASGESSQQNTVQAQVEIAEQPSSIQDELETLIKDELREIVTDSEAIVNRDRFRVPDHIKKLNPLAYTPRLISIGPLHHGHPALQPMEAFKKRYAHSFIENHKVEIKDLIRITESCETSLRNDYEIDSSTMPSQEFVKIMLIDGTFLLEFLCRHHDGSYEEIDRMTHKKWKILICDLFLLENQIPYKYLETVLALALGPDRINGHLTKLDDLFDIFLSLSVLPQFVYGSRVFLRLSSKGDKFPIKHNLDSLRSRMAYPTESFDKAKGRQSKTLSCPTISQLLQAGIKLKPGTNPHWSWKYNCPQGIEFHSDAKIAFRHGVLQIPRFIIDENTKCYFLNLLAAELSREHNRFATDYIALIDYLIDGAEDVHILVERGIVQNLLEDNKAAAMINQIGKLVDVRHNFRYSALVEDLQAHYRSRWNKWKFEWKRDLVRNYVGNPWRALSVIAAIILLGLTVVQTVCSVLQVQEFKLQLPKW